MKEFTKLFFTVLVFAGLTSCSGKAVSVADSDIERKINRLVSEMTIEEKVGQMNQISSYGNIEDMIGLVKKGEVGSILNETDPARINALQRIAVEESRLGIPILMARDVIHGFKTIFPIPLGQAATFDPEIVEKGARVAAMESASVGIRWTFSPMLDVSRDPRWGRIAEGSGEDPYLTSVMGVAMIKGYQGEEMSDPSSIAACPKHFVGYAAAEGGRDYNSTYIPERELRNVYLPPFEAVAKAGAATFMTSFNANDGIPSSGNSFILRDVLRNEWNFDGFVVSDWASIVEMVTHGFASDPKEAAMKAVNAGVDMEMVSYSYVNHLKELVNEGKVPMSVIDNAVRNILRIKFRLGLFDNPYVDESLHEKVFYSNENLETALKAAEESVILLKNDGVLPLEASVKTVAVVGPMADAPYEQLGTWIFDGEKNMTVTPLQAIRKQFGKDVKVIYAPGLEYSRDKSTAGILSAVSAARNADVTIAFIGEESILSGEAHSLADLNLQGAQTELIKELAATGKPLVTVIMAGRPLTVEKEIAMSSAVLYSFHPGTMGGPAIANLLWGKAVPSGKTPMTFLKTVGQVPMYYAHTNTGRPAQRNEVLLDDIPVEAGQTSLGCTSFYLDAGFDPLYPFGYGLSYTEFEYSNIRIVSDGTGEGSNVFGKKDVLRVSFDLKNVGKYEGTEVAQLYVRDLTGSVARPVKELKRFVRISLKPGESRSVTFELPVSELAFWNIDMEKTVEPGDFQLWVATDSRSGDPLTFKVE